MSKHNSSGHAVVHCEYTFGFKRVEEQARKPNGDVIAITPATPVSSRGDVSQSFTLYAKCKHGQTGDDWISRWYREVALPEAGIGLASLLQKKREANVNRQREWERKVPVAEQRSLTANPRPPVLLYDDLDMSRLRVKALFSTDEELGSDFGKRIAWLPEGKHGQGRW